MRLGRKFETKKPPLPGGPYRGSAARQNEVGIAARAAASCRAPAPVPHKDEEPPRRGTSREITCPWTFPCRALPRADCVSLHHQPVLLRFVGSSVVSSAASADGPLGAESAAGSAVPSRHPASAVNSATKRSACSFTVEKPLFSAPR